LFLLCHSECHSCSCHKDKEQKGCSFSLCSLPSHFKRREKQKKEEEGSCFSLQGYPCVLSVIWFGPVLDTQKTPPSGLSWGSAPPLLLGISFWS
jgi:hypothetical protein